MYKSLLLIISLVLFNCTSKIENNNSKINTAPIQANWQVLLLNGSSIDLEEPLVLNFDQAGKVNGNIGCNNVTGNYTVDNQSKIEFSKLATTRMTCPNMEIESEILNILNSSSSYSIENDSLTIQSQDNTSLIVLTRIDHPEIVNKYWKLIELDGKEVTMSENQEREQYFTLRNDSTVTGFAGCNQLNGSYSIVDGNRIKFESDMAVTLKNCLDTDINEQDYLEVFRIANNYTINEDTLMLNIGKRAPLAVFEAVYF